MNELKRYLAGFDEINKIIKTYEDSFKVSEETKTEKISAETIIRECNDFLIDAYIEGFCYAGYLLGDDVNKHPEMSKINGSINKRIAGQKFYDRLGGYQTVGDVNGIRGVFSTEYHRVFNEAVLDRANSMSDNIPSGKSESGTSSDREIYKQWVTIKDDKVRDTHFYLEGKSVPIGEKFITIDGDEALAPGGFESAENNVNCRCVLRVGYKA